MLTVEQHEPRFVNGRDRHLVVPRPVTWTVLQRPDRFPQVILVTRPDAEKQAELARRSQRGHQAWAFLSKGLPRSFSSR